MYHQKALANSYVLARPTPVHGMASALLRPELLLAASSAIMFLHMFFADEKVSNLSRAIAGVIAFFAYFSILRAVQRRHEQELPYREAYTASFYIFFVLPIFGMEPLPLVNGLYIPSTEAIEWALYASVLSLSVFWVFSHFGLRLGQMARHWIAAPLPKRLPQLNAGRFILVVIAPLVLVAHYMMVHVPDSIPVSMRQLVVSFLSPTLLLAATLWLADKTNINYYRLAATILFLSLSLIGLLSGMLENLLQPVLVVLAYRWVAGKRLPMKWILLGIILFLFLNPAKLSYRAQTASLAEESGRALSFEEKLEVWQDAIATKWFSSESSENLTQNLDSTRSRISDLVPVAQAIEYVPERVPYANGAPWLAIPYSFVPRLLWEGKPDLTQISNSLYATIFNRLSESQTAVTAFNIPQMADGYWNFGWLGIVIVAGAAGLVVGFQARAFDVHSWTTCAIGILFFTRLRAQGDLNTFITGGIQLYIGAVVFLGLIALGGRVLRMRG